MLGTVELKMSMRARLGNKGWQSSRGCLLQYPSAKKFGVYFAGTQSLISGMRFKNLWQYVEDG